MGQIDHINVTRHCKHKKHFKRICVRKGLKGTALRNCIFDRCGGFSRKDERRVWRLIHKEKRVHMPRHFIKRLPIVRPGIFLGGIRRHHKHHHHHHHHHRHHRHHHHKRRRFIRR